MTIIDALEKKATGLFYNNRVILPFRCYFLKVIIENDIITDFSSSSKGIAVEEEDSFTNLYFNDYAKLKQDVSKYESIKMVVVEKGKDLFDTNNHIKLALYLRDEHKVVIEKTDDEILFLE
ncbi:MAG: hypothetical protein K8H86_15585 [Ignavibacteriaceae bacterium]|nr:hypothetical protein [Ignavibacteriaceae bacterium]